MKALQVLFWFIALVGGVYLLVPALIQGAWFKALIAAILAVVAYQKLTRQV